MASMYHLSAVPLHFESRHKELVVASAANLSKQELYTASLDGMIKAWDAHSLGYKFQLASHKCWITALHYSVEMKLLISSGLDGSLSFWSVRGAIPKLVRNEAPSSSLGGIYSMAVKGTQIALGGKRDVSVWEVNDDFLYQNRGPVLRPLGSHSGHSDRVTCIQFLTHTSEKLVVSGSADGSLVVHPTNELKHGVRKVVLPHAHPRGVVAMCCSIDGTLWSASYAGDIKAWPFATIESVLNDVGVGLEVSNNARLKPRFDIRTDRTIKRLAILNESQHLWCSSENLLPILYDANTGSNISDVMMESLGISEVMDLFQSGSKQACLTHMEVHNDRILAAYDNKRLLVWQHCNEGMVNDALSCSEGLAEALSVKHDAFGGTVTLYSAHSSGNIVPWPVVRSRSGGGKFSQDNSYRLCGHTCAVTAMVTIQEEHPDLAHLELVSGSEDGEISVWGFEKDDQLGTLDADYRDFHTNSFESGRTSTAFLLESDDAPAALASRELLKIGRWQAHRSRVVGLANSGSLIVSASVEGELRCWDLFSCELLGEELCAHGTLEEEHQPDSGAEDLFEGLTGMSLAKQNQSTCAIQDMKRVIAELKKQQAQPGASIVMPKPLEAVLGILATSSTDKSVKLWVLTAVGTLDSLSVKLETHSTLQHRHEVTAIVWAKCTQTWISASADFTICVWDIDGKRQCSMLCRGAVPTVLTVNEQAATVLVGDQSGALKVFDVASGAMCCQYPGHDDAVKALAHVPEMGQYISSSWDHSLRVWKAQGTPRGDVTQSGEARPATTLNMNSTQERQNADLYPGIFPTTVFVTATTTTQIDSESVSDEDEANDLFEQLREKQQAREHNSVCQ